LKTNIYASRAIINIVPRNFPIYPSDLANLAPPSSCVTIRPLAHPPVRLDYISLLAYVVLSRIPVVLERDLLAYEKDEPGNIIYVREDDGGGGRVVGYPRDCKGTEIDSRGRLVGC
jgi:hypothetical protein